jgi:hypothetical protein
VLHLLRIRDVIDLGFSYSDDLLYLCWLHLVVSIIISNCLLFPVFVVFHHYF